jgi:zinc transporter 1/2/3
MVFQSIYAVIGIPVIFILGFTGSMTPPLLAYFFPSYNITKKYWFTFFNGIAAGVILAVGFIHSLNDSQNGFTATVYDYGEYSLTDNYAWADWICMVAILMLFTLEEIMAIIANRCGLRSLDPHYNGIDVEPRKEDDSMKEDDGNELNTYQAGEDDGKDEYEAGSSSSSSNEDDGDNDEEAAKPKKGSSSSNEEDDDDTDEEAAKPKKSSSSSNEEDDDDNDEEAAKPKKKKKRQQRGSVNLFLKMILLFIGLDLHNIFIGLALGISDNDYVLFIALLFHQFFEGLGMGSRVAMAKLRSIWFVIAIDLMFASVPSIFIAIGIGIKQGINDADSTYGYNLTKAILQGMSAGILIYIALVHMMRAYRDNGSSLKHRDIHSIYSYFGLLFGCAVMAVIGIWA